MTLELKHKNFKEKSHYLFRSRPTPGPASQGCRDRWVHFWVGKWNYQAQTRRWCRGFSCIRATSRRAQSTFWRRPERSIAAWQDIEFWSSLRRSISYGTLFPNLNNLARNPPGGLRAGRGLNLSISFAIVRLFYTWTKTIALLEDRPSGLEGQCLWGPALRALRGQAESIE